MTLLSLSRLSAAGLMTVLLLAAPIDAVAQGREEVERLRAFLSLPESVAIEIAEGGSVDLKSGLTVYLATDAEPTAAERVRAFVGELNRDEAAKGAIREVSRLSEADVVLVQFEAQEKRRIEADNRLTMDPSLGSRAQGGRSDRAYRSEIRTYVLLRTEASYRLVEAHRKSVKLGGRRDELRNAFKRVLERSGSR